MFPDETPLLASEPRSGTTSVSEDTPSLTYMPDSRVREIRDSTSAEADTVTVFAALATTTGVL